MFNSENSSISLPSGSDKLKSKQNQTKQNNMSEYQATSMMKALPFSFEEVSIDRDNVITRDVNEYSNVRIFAFHTNIRMRFLDSNIRIIF